MSNGATPTEFLQISHSSLGTAAGCLRRFEFRKLYPRPSIAEDSFAAEVGKALHAGTQDYIVSRDVDSAMWALMKTYPHVESFTQAKDDRSLWAAMSTQEAIIEQDVFGDYEVSMIVRPDGLTVPAIEVPYAIELKGIVLSDGRGVKHVGYIDAIMRHKGSGVHRTLDVKTHRGYEKDRSPEYQFSGQQVPYGLVVDHVAGQTAGHFEVLYLDAKVDLTDPIVTPYVFEKTRADVEEWLVDTVLQVQRIQKAMEMNHFPRTANGCTSFNKPCHFFNICDSRDRESLMEWFLMGAEPQWPKPVEPWITIEVDVFG